MDAAAEHGRNPVSKHQIQPGYGHEQANADKEVLFFPVQLTTSRIGSLTRLIHTLAICVTIHTYIPWQWTLFVSFFIVSFLYSQHIFLLSIVGFRQML